MYDESSLYGPRRSHSPLMLKGIFPVLPTPFAPGGTVAFPDFEAAVRFALASGAHGVVYPGTASEASFLTSEERERLAFRLAEIVDGRVPIVAGVSGQSIAEVKKHIGIARKIGSQALMLVPGKAFGASLKELIGNLRSLDTGGIPLMLQNVPAPVGVNLSADDLSKLVLAVDAVHYIKEEGLPSGHPVARALAVAGESLKGVFGGGGARYIMDELIRGSSGAMPAVELVDVHVQLYKAFLANDLNLVRLLYDTTLPLLMMQAVFRTGLTKHVLQLRGVIEHTHIRADFPLMDETDIQEAGNWVQYLEERLADIGQEVAAWRSV